MRQMTHIISLTLQRVLERHAGVTEPIITPELVEYVFDQYLPHTNGPTHKRLCDIPVPNFPGLTIAVWKQMYNAHLCKVSLYFDTCRPVHSPPILLISVTENGTCTFHQTATSIWAEVAARWKQVLKTRSRPRLLDV